MVEIFYLSSHTLKIGKNIKAKKQLLKNEKIIQENQKRINHDYKLNDNVLIYRDGITRKLDGPFLGPYKLIEMYTH